MEQVGAFFTALYEAIVSIFDTNVDENGEKRNIFERIKEALDVLFGVGA